MTITNQDQLFNALANDSSRFIVDKASLANAVAGQLFSLWRTTGQPAQGAIPTTAAIPTSATTGAISFTNQTAPRASYLTWAQLVSANNAMSVEIHDRVAHNGGLVLNVTTSQTTNLPLDIGPSALNLGAGRRGDANFSDCQWWLEVYTDGGATASNATINVTYNDATTGNLTVVAVGGTLRAGRMIPLTPLIPTADQGKFIRGINSVILSASTTVAGNFGFTCTRHRTVVPLPLANFPGVIAWNTSGSPEIINDACLQFIVQTSTTSTGTLRGTGKIAHG
jgi:hypothetical protein